MSEDEKQVAIVPFADFTMRDLQDIEKFKEDGMLGLHTLVDTDVERCMNLYLGGKTYRQIANVTRIKKNVVLFLAHKFKWYELRRDYLDELHATMKDKIVDSKLQSQEFLFHLLLAYQKKIGQNIDKYLRTDDVKHFEEVDSKDLTGLLKIQEMLYKISGDTFGTPQGDKSLVSLNGMSEGVTITKTGTNSVEITPKSPFSNKLKQFADLKRQQEKESQAPQKPIHDIVQESEKPLTEKEVKNEESK